MNLLITGCNGSVGKRIVRLALNRGYIVTGVDFTILSEELKELIEHKKDNFTYHQIDLGDYDCALEILRTSECQAVIHLAAVRDPKDYKVHTHNSNVVLSWNILRACAELGITRIAQASSVNVVKMVYSVQADFKYFPIDEDHPREPDEPYGLSKLICELQADTIARRYPTLRIASLRLSWSLPRKDYAWGRQAQDAAKDLWGYVYEDSVADAFLLSITCDTTKWPSKHEAFLVAAPEINRDLDSGDLKRSFYPDVPVKEGFEIKGRQGFFDCRKAERLLGWVHRDNMPE
ncbi:hypothetical protein AGABI1DRAFT_42376 [Agaricus bisporus var. burnettii JB137-S8]|uniref:NAD-dependent epimerase/dehydratase domain-containing protein n=1 Tax=Agaricus bisporus var. burnettii (strain JB137-S8 / ATCC MYA-4627 / FGSC 10392) TaxID=597362 RepID=K5XT12_AGABU|nr:uncharacterized protein AGABI1DRAFT_42376 [Agaricus bisporus var. burnettii JB137-S8]EKM78120.1 hypothetical protein AGABI1DRAFT_42376 [Agaricus bisporus var. burnettii JB137-S8]